MKLRQVKMASFVKSTLVAVQTAVNAFTAGLAVSSGDSGTVAYAAGESGERTLVDQQYAFDGANHAVVLFYAE